MLERVAGWRGFLSAGLRAERQGPEGSLIDDRYDALALGSTPVVGHSLGGMFALWYAAARPGRIGSLVVVGDPAVALPGVVVRMPLSPMTVPILGPAMLRTPSPRPMYRQVFGMGNGRAAAAAATTELLDVLRFAGRRPGNARTVAALMHATGFPQASGTGSRHRARPGA